jgi:3-mercaptopyruvate sulfurtransferase SseA
VGAGCADSTDVGYRDERAGAGAMLVWVMAWFGCEHVGVRM